MRIDLYTKVCLTVISLSLCVIAFKDTSIIKPSWAFNHVVHKIEFAILKVILVLVQTQEEELTC